MQSNSYVAKDVLVSEGWLCRSCPSPKTATGRVLASCFPQMMKRQRHLTLI